MGSESFQRFLHLLGDTVTLKGWTGYRGGLDTKSKNSSEAKKVGGGCSINAFVYCIYILYILQKYVDDKCFASPGKSQVNLNDWCGMQLKKSVYRTCIFKVNGFILYWNGLKNT